VERKRHGMKRKRSGTDGRWFSTQFSYTGDLDSRGSPNNSAKMHARAKSSVLVPNKSPEGISVAYWGS